jgi:hypothetical protein
LDAAPAVATEVPVPRIRAPLHHGAPRSPRGTPGHAMRRSPGAPLVLRASAAGTLSAAEVPSGHHARRSAVAPAVPPVALLFVMRASAKDRPHPEPVTRQIDERSHGF